MNDLRGFKATYTNFLNQEESLGVNNMSGTSIAILTSTATQPEPDAIILPNNVALDLARWILKELEDADKNNKNT